MSLDELTLDDLVENFALFDDWESRYTYVLDLAKQLPPFPEDAKSPENKVEGCVSQVWMVPCLNEGTFSFTADSDAHIVRGLIAILMIAYNNKTADEISRVDIESTFETLGLSSHLSPNRRNGFFAMVGRIKSASAPS